MPSEKKQTAFRLEPEILDGLQVVKDRIGIPISEQVRRALRDWLQRHRALGKAERRRAVGRKRA